MLLDKQNQFSNAQAVTAAAISANVIDLGPLSGGNLIRDIGAGEELGVLIRVDTTMDDTGDDSTLIVTLESDDNVGLSSATVHQTITTFAALSAANTQLYVPILPGAYQRYLGLRYTPGAGGNLSAGAFSAWLVRGKFDTRVYASGVTNAV